MDVPRDVGTSLLNQVVRPHALGTEHQIHYDEWKCTLIYHVTAVGLIVRFCEVTVGCVCVTIKGLGVRMTGIFHTSKFI